MIEIIDFERLNDLTADTNEIPDTNYVGAVWKYTTTRRMMKEYIQVYTDHISKDNSRISKRQYDEKYKGKETYVETVLETLRYNKVLINKREITLGEVLD